MKVQEKVQVDKTYVAVDGKEFTDKAACESHEFFYWRCKVPEAGKYVISIGGEDYMNFLAFKKTYRYKNPQQSWVGNLKYAKKFLTFEEAYEIAKDNLEGSRYNSPWRITPIEEAKPFSDKYIKKQEMEKDREQRYVKVYTKEEKPSVDGEYITSKGMLTYFSPENDEPSWRLYSSFGSNGPHYVEAPEFWMKKVNKNVR
jgi:hypothetical protein